MSRLGRLLDRVRPPVDVSERHRIERVLASARAFVAVASAVVVYLDPLTPTRHTQEAHLLLGVYLAVSLGILIRLRMQREVRPRVQTLVHGVDVLWAALVPLATEGDHAPLFIFFVFVVVAAAARWGFRKALASGGAVLAIVLVESAFVTPAGSSPGAEVNGFLVRAAYLIIAAALLGYVARQAKNLNAGSSVVARIVGKVQAEASLRTTLQIVAAELLDFFGGTRVLLAIEDTVSGRAFLWDADRQAIDGELTVRASELDGIERRPYLFAARATSWLAVRRSRPGANGPFHFVGLDDRGRRVDDAPSSLPDAWPSPRPVHAIVGVSVTLGDQYTGRVVLVGPSDPGVGSLRLFQQLVQQIAPAVYGVHVAHLLRNRIGAVERVRIARELHDGVTQSLISAEMQIDVLRRRVEPEAPRVAREVARIQALLRQEVANLRDATQRLRSSQVGPKQLLRQLADEVDRFQRETGIRARFESDVSQVRLTPRTCREVVHIVQEGLSNVRRHSAAHHVLVRFSGGDGRWTLTLDDDGRGFPFAGRFEQEALDAMREGPQMIKERVRELCGQLVLRSAPGQGAHLEITFP